MSGIKGFFKGLPGFVIEQFTRFLTVIQSDHAYIHEGIGFKFCNKVSSLEAGASTSILITIPADKYIHFRPSKFSSTANIVLLEVYEDPTDDAEWSTGTPQNLNRNSSNVSGITIEYGSNVSDDGDFICHDTVGTGGITNRGGGSSSGANEEIVMKPSTMYLIKITNIGTTTATDVYYSLFWYEEGQG